MTRYQLIGSTRLTRGALQFLLEKERGRVVGVDPGSEDESCPWFAPIKGLCRDNGIPIGRFDADVVLDLDPDANPIKGEGPMVRLLGPPGARSPDINRALLGPGLWRMVFTDREGLYAFSLKEVGVQSEESAEGLMARAVLAGLEALAEGLEKMSSQIEPLRLPYPLSGGRWRAQEGFVIWEQPVERVVARIRAAAGPWGGARTYLGETPVWLEDATVVSSEAVEGWLPGTIVAQSQGLDVATGRGILHIKRLRPGWRPSRPAGEYVTEVGAGIGYQFT